MNVQLPLPCPRACATTVSFALAALMLAAPVAARAGTGTVTDPLVAPLLVPEPVSAVAPFRADRAPVAPVLELPAPPGPTNPQFRRSLTGGWYRVTEAAPTPWAREPSAIEAAFSAPPAPAWREPSHCVPTKAGPNWTDAHGRPPCETLRERVMRGW